MSFFARCLPSGLAPLHLAVRRDGHRCLRLLVESGAKVNAPELKGGHAALHMAINQNLLKVACTLVTEVSVDTRRRVHERVGAFGGSPTVACSADITRLILTCFLFAVEGGRERSHFWRKHASSPGGCRPRAHAVLRPAGRRYARTQPPSRTHTHTHKQAQGHEPFPKIKKTEYTLATSLTRTDRFLRSGADKDAENDEPLVLSSSDDDDDEEREEEEAGAEVSSQPISCRKRRVGGHTALDLAKCHKVANCPSK